LQVFTSLRLAGFPRNIALDTTVVGFTLLLSLGTGLIFGALPALQISRPDLMEVLRESTRSLTASGAHQRLRGAFVVVQVSLALVLLMGAGLTINSLWRLNTVQAGLDPRGLVAFQVPFSRAFYASAGTTPTGGFQVDVSSRINLLTERIRARAALLPGVESATLAVTPPVGGEPPRMRFIRQGQPVSTAEQEAWSAEYYPVGDEYFRTLKVPLLRGRELGPQDSDTGAPVTVINATMARTFWPNEDPIGKRLQLEVLYDSPREIVGVVGDVHQVRYQRAPQPQLYVPRAQLPRKMGMTTAQEIMLANTFVIRTRGDAAALVPALRAAVAEVDPTQAISTVRTVEEYASGQLQDLRQYATLFTIFGCISVALAAVGLFGIMAHLVNQRTNEIGIRKALGAPNGAVLVDVLQRGVVLIAIGLALGMAVSFVLTRLIQNLLWGVTATDPLTFALALLAMLAVALLACCVPARRALKVDPVIALRAE
jgi:putative ABC transport system permease protein